jgi:hypothetical protein
LDLKQKNFGRNLMKTQEIYLLINFAEQGAAVVEKETNILWSLEDLWDARAEHKFEIADFVSAPGGNIATTSIYPGCPNMSGKLGGDGAGEIIGQTSHFLIFGPPSLEEAIRP